MSDSMLGKFIRSIRLKNGISDFKAAYRLDISVKKYLSLESHPEFADIELLNSLFTALGLTNDEVFEYEKFEKFYSSTRKESYGKNITAITS